MTAQLDRLLSAVRTQFADEINRGEIVHLGTTNCRRKNNRPSAPWSEHSWPNAVDIMLKNFSGRKALGDRIAAWGRGSSLVSETFWWVQAHYDHVHLTANPRMNHDNRQVPPCAGGAPPPTNQGDDMLGFNIGAKGAEPVRGEQAAALQLLLNDRGAKLTVDGIAGDATRNALIAFQTAKGVGPPERGSGELGAYTYSALYKPLQGAPGKPGAAGVTEAKAKSIARAEINKAKVSAG